MKEKETELRESLRKKLEEYEIRLEEVPNLIIGDYDYKMGSFGFFENDQARLISFHVDERDAQMTDITDNPLEVNTRRLAMECDSRVRAVKMFSGGIKK